MIKILCLGDSLTNGARNEYFRDYTQELNYLIKNKIKKDNICINESVNGETSSEILKRATKILFNNSYDFVLLLAGTNDTKVPIPLYIYEKNIIQIIDNANVAGAKVIIGLLPPIYTGLPCYSKTEGNKIIKKYNESIIKISKKKKLKVVSFINFKEKFYSDGVHLNYIGYVEMARRWLGAIKDEL